MQGQRRNTLLPGELETSEHNRKTKQDWGPAAMTTDVHISQICVHQQLSRNWQLAAQISIRRLCELPWPRIYYGP